MSAPNKQPNILAIETATAACSVALLCSGQVHSASEVGTNIHSKRLLDMVQTVLHEAELKPSDLDAIAVGQGPGSFTGLRIGIGAAQGIAYGASCPMIGITSLAALAVASKESGLVIAALDARMGEVYWAAYTKAKQSDAQRVQNIEMIGEVGLLAPIALRQQVDAIANKHDSSASLLGNAWKEYAQELGDDFFFRHTVVGDLIYPHAEHLLPLAVDRFLAGDTISPGKFVAQYVRNDVAKKASKK